MSFHNENSLKTKLNKFFISRLHISYTLRLEYMYVYVWYRLNYCSRSVSYFEVYCIIQKGRFFSESCHYNMTGSNRLMRSSTSFKSLSTVRLNHLLYDMTCIIKQLLLYFNTTKRRIVLCVLWYAYNDNNIIAVEIPFLH